MEMEMGGCVMRLFFPLVRVVGETMAGGSSIKRPHYGRTILSNGCWWDMMESCHLSRHRKGKCR